MIQNLGDIAGSKYLLEILEKPEIIEKISKVKRNEIVVPKDELAIIIDYFKSKLNELKFEAIDIFIRLDSNYELKIFLISKHRIFDTSFWLVLNENEFDKYFKKLKYTNLFKRYI